MPPPAQPAATQAELAERRRRQELAHELAELSVDLARTAAAEAKQDPTPANLTAFERVARGARRALLLAQKLSEVPRHLTRTEARQEVARQVEHRIAAHCPEDHPPADYPPEDRLAADHPALERPSAERLRAELAERLDGPDLGDDLLLRPLADITEQICADLGLNGPEPASVRRRAAEDISRLFQPATRHPGAVWPATGAGTPGPSPRRSAAPHTPVSASVARRLE